MALVHFGQHFLVLFLLLGRQMLGDFDPDLLEQGVDQRPALLTGFLHAGFVGLEDGEHLLLLRGIEVEAFGQLRGDMLGHVGGDLGELLDAGADDGAVAEESEADADEERGQQEEDQFGFSHGGLRG